MSDVIVHIVDRRLQGPDLKVRMRFENSSLISVHAVFEILVNVEIEYLNVPLKRCTVICNYFELM